MVPALDKLVVFRQAGGRQIQKESISVNEVSAMPEGVMRRQEVTEPSLGDWQGFLQMVSDMVQSSTVQWKYTASYICNCNCSSRHIKKKQEKMILIAYFNQPSISKILPFHYPISTQIINEMVHILLIVLSL